VILQTKNAGLRDWLAIAGGMVGCFMAILDIQITNSSLAPIEGGMGASVDEGSWISTAYLIAEIVVIPLTGWLSAVFGLRRYLAVNTALFVLFSIGLRPVDQHDRPDPLSHRPGLHGGVLIPTGLTVIRRHLPPHQQAIGMSLFGVSATFAPAIGPSIGGWLTENFSWHYLFYLNIGPGLLAIASSVLRPAQEPMKLRELIDGDWWGIGTMAVGLGSMTIVLEEGQRHEWFGSPMIQHADRDRRHCASLLHDHRIHRRKTVHQSAPVRPIHCRLVEPAVDRGRRGQLCSLFLIPVYLAEVPHFSTQQIGSVVMWSGLPQLAIFPMMPFLLNRVRPRTWSVPASRCSRSAVSSMPT